MEHISARVQEKDPPLGLGAALLGAAGLTMATPGHGAPAVILASTVAVLAGLPLGLDDAAHPFTGAPADRVRGRLGRALLVVSASALIAPMALNAGPAGAIGTVAAWWGLVRLPRPALAAAVGLVAWTLVSGGQIALTGPGWSLLQPTPDVAGVTPAILATGLLLAGAGTGRHAAAKVAGGVWWTVAAGLFAALTALLAHASEYDASLGARPIGAAVASLGFIAAVCGAAAGAGSRRTTTLAGVAATGWFSLFPSTVPAWWRLGLPLVLAAALVAQWGAGPRVRPTGLLALAAAGALVAALFLGPAWPERPLEAAAHAAMLVVIAWTAAVPLLKEDR
jgi:hypothetical protein